MFDSLYEKYSGPLFGILLNLTDNDEVLAADLLKKVFVEYFFQKGKYIQTTASLLPVLLRLTVQVASSHGFSSQSITSLIRPPAAAMI